MLTEMLTFCFSDALQDLASRSPSMDWLTGKLSELGFANIEVHIPEEPLMQLDLYLNQQGPFDEVFRNSDSGWSLATDAQLKAGLEWWRAELDAGNGDAFMQERETMRKAVGQTSSIIAS